MLKIVVAGTTALFLTASPIANAQTSQRLLLHPND